MRKLEAQDENLKTLESDIAGTLHAEVSAMNVDNFVVRTQRKYVEQYRDAKAWENIPPDEAMEIANRLAGLPSEREAEDETAKRFDLLMMKTQLAILDKSSTFKRLEATVRDLATRLEEKGSIPVVREQMPLILEIQTDEYWADVSLPMLDIARKRLRDLIKFIDKRERKIVYTDFADELGEVHEVALTGFGAAGDLAQYRKKIRHFLKAHESHIAVNKLKHNVPITPTDIKELERLLFESSDLGDREDFEKSFGVQEQLGEFIRRLVGLDREAAKRAFGEYLNDATFNANQIRFVNQIIDYLTQNGVMDAARLYESPYTDYSSEGLDGVFKDAQAGKIVDILEDIRRNAAA